MNDEEYTEPVITRREAMQGGSAAAVAAGAVIFQDQFVTLAKAATAEPRIELGDSSNDPASNGHFQRNGSDVKVYSGGSVRNLSNIGSGGGALTDSGTDTDGGDDYTLPNAADNVDLQSDGEILNAQAVTTDEASITNVAAKASPSSNQTVSTSTVTTINLGTSNIDHSSVVTTNLSNNSIDVQVAGTYYILVRHDWSNNNNWSTGDRVQVGHSVNGTNNFRDTPKVGTTTQSVLFVWTKELSANDTIKALAYHESGGDRTLNAGSTKFSAARLG